MPGAAAKSADFDNMTDEEIVKSAQSGNDLALEYLLNKYCSYVRHRAKTYFLIGADKEDLIQEGMIGLFKAIRDYKTDKLSSFKCFAELCITRQIITAIKTATRQKHAPLNTYVSLNKPLFDQEYNVTLLNFISRDQTVNPEEIMISKEQYDDIGLKMEEMLSTFECKVLSLYLTGKSYQEIALALGKHPKSIDNALQRIKRKMEKCASKLT